MTDPMGWQRLSRLLVERRLELGYAKRAPFARANGLSHDRVLFDLENARRDNYDPATLALVEQIYRWRRGSIEAVREGGDPTPVDDSNAEPLPAFGVSPLDVHDEREVRQLLAQIEAQIADALRAEAEALRAMVDAQQRVAVISANRSVLEVRASNLHGLLEAMTNRERTADGDTAATTAAGDDPAGRTPDVTDLASRRGVVAHEPPPMPESAAARRGEIDPPVE